MGSSSSPLASSSLLLLLFERDCIFYNNTGLSPSLLLFVQRRPLDGWMEWDEMRKWMTFDVVSLRIKNKLCPCDRNWIPSTRKREERWRDWINWYSRNELRAFIDGSCGWIYSVCVPIHLLCVPFPVPSHSSRWITIFKTLLFPAEGKYQWDSLATNHGLTKWWGWR